MVRTIASSRDGVLDEVLVPVPFFPPRTEARDDHVGGKEFGLVVVPRWVGTVNDRDFRVDERVLLKRRQSDDSCFHRVGQRKEGAQLVASPVEVLLHEDLSVDRVRTDNTIPAGFGGRSRTIHHMTVAFLAAFVDDSHDEARATLAAAGGDGGLD